HQADAVPRRDQPVGVLEKKFVAEPFAGARKLNHGLDSSSHKNIEIFICQASLSADFSPASPQIDRQEPGEDHGRACSLSENKGNTSLRELVFPWSNQFGRF